MDPHFFWQTIALTHLKRHTSVYYVLSTWDLMALLQILPLSRKGWLFWRRKLTHLATMHKKLTLPSPLSGGHIQDIATRVWAELYGRYREELIGHFFTFHFLKRIYYNAQRSTTISAQALRSTKCLCGAICSKDLCTTDCVLGCGHIFHHLCLADYVEQRNLYACPECFWPFPLALETDNVSNDIRCHFGLISVVG